MIKENWKDAKVRCEKIIALRPNYAEAYNNLAIIYAKENDYANALKNYAKALNLQPDYVAAHHNLGLFFLKHEKINEAMTQFNNVVALEPMHLAAHYHLGNLYLGKNQLDLAEQHYNDVLTLDPEHSDTWCNVGVIALKQDNPQLAIDHFTKALAYDNDHQDARNNLAATFMLFDRYENAITHYLELLTVDPDNNEYHYNIAVAYMQLGHLNDAMTHFETVLEKHSDHAASLNNIAAIVWRLGDTQKAEDYFSKALAIEPDNTTSRYMLTALQSKNNVDVNRDTSNSHIISNPKDKQYYNQHGAPTEYIKNLFDNYAVQYDEHLCQQLGYKIPEKIGELLKENKENCLDLGCGTGLLGQYLKPHYKKLIGVDLSQKMLNNAEKIGFYDKLICDDIMHFLEGREGKNKQAKSDKNSQIPQTWDCICAAEVFEYFGDLAPVFQQIASHLKPHGIFIFSIERAEGSENFVLQETARFAHNINYIQQLAKQNHFTIIHQIPMAGRMQNHQPLSSCLFFMECGKK